MGKQKELPGVERPKIQELEDKAEVYARAVKANKKAADALKADKTALLAAMKKHGVNSYRTDDGVIFSVQEGAQKVAMSEVEEEEHGTDAPGASEKAN